MRQARTMQRGQRPTQTGTHTDLLVQGTIDFTQRCTADILGDHIPARTVFGNAMNLLQMRMLQAGQRARKRGTRIIEKVEDNRSIQETVMRDKSILLPRAIWP